MLFQNQEENQITLTLFERMPLSISKEDWEFLCKYRFFTEKPDIDTIQAEFTSGTGITKKKVTQWGRASEEFAEYIKDRKDIMLNMDVNQMARSLINKVR